LTLSRHLQVADDKLILNAKITGTLNERGRPFVPDELARMVNIED
jgi:hypothetical protein